MILISRYNICCNYQINEDIYHYNHFSVKKYISRPLTYFETLKHQFIESLEGTDPTTVAKMFESLTLAIRIITLIIKVTV